MTGNGEQQAGPGLAKARGLKNRFPDHFATSQLPDLLKHLGVSIDDPQGVYLALVYKMAARVERSFEGPQSHGARFEVGQYLINLRLLLLDQDDPHVFPDTLVLNARQRGIVQLVKRAHDDINSVRTSLKRLDELQAQLFEIMKEAHE